MDNKREEGGHHVQPVENGTLTGLATRDSDGRKVLVTNLHVMTGSIGTNPSGGEDVTGFESTVPTGA